MPSMNSFVVHTVAIAGAGGHLGRKVLDALLEEEAFDVTILVRRGRTLMDYPPGVRFTTVDYGSPQSLRAALQGIDAVVSALGKKTGLECQFNLIDAAVAAGVKRFIPSEFGADLQNPKIRGFPTYRTKVQTEQYLEKLADRSSLTYTYIYNSLLLEDGLEMKVFGDFSARTINIYDGGNTAFSTTRMTTVARAVVAVLKQFEATKNRAVRIRDISISPNELLRRIQKRDSGHQWTPVAVDAAALVKEAEGEWASGRFSPKAFAAFATRATFARGIAGSYNGDNERLGIEEMTRKEMEDALQGRLL
ncbi:hypothetical protein Daus18300_013860 [Diaporthe australafricana]|uniref:NmrA-like domain-containing protein n=1 Tax=Diaporthe australafricana TaxID=127596 RepID=A0ABR3VXF1_9PEZI